MPSTLIEPQLQAWLVALPVVANAGTSVYPWAGVPEDVTFPYVTYHTISAARLGNLRARGGVGRPVIQIDCFGTTYGSAKNIADGIRETLDGYCTANDGTMGGKKIQVAIVSDEWDEEQNPVHGDEVTQYRVSLSVEIWFVES